MNKKNPIIKSFKIKGLFGNKSISINFKESIKIVIGENGTGKTTILNIIYYCLTNKISKLKLVDFEEIHINFGSGKKAVLTRNDLISETTDKELSGIETRISHELSAIIDDDTIDELFQMIEDKRMRDDIIDYLGQKDEIRAIIRRYPTSIVYSSINSLIKNNYSNGIIEFRKVVKQEIAGINILYFPTYRRIEEELVNLGISSDPRNPLPKDDSRLIQFGMNDVIERFQQIKNNIEVLSSRGFTEISSEILSQLISGDMKISSARLKTINEENIDIILGRVGKQLSEQDQEQIKKVVNKKLTLSENTDKPLLFYFLDKLIRIYENQTSIDNSIYDFVKRCNNYLESSNKKIKYEPSEVEFYLELENQAKRDLKSVLGKLSSGEKQIISLFSKLYLSTKPEDFIVLFDEPELSLSIQWQKLLLPDIISSNKCQLLLAVTHSPFIFGENGLAIYAGGLENNNKN